MEQGFREGFNLCYEGPVQRRNTSKNIPFTVGNKYVLWDKVMKEVETGRFAGPFDTIPFDYFVQSPIGLVPKAGGKTRLIFHLSYDFSAEDQNLRSINYFIPKQLCSVRYNDLDAVVKACIEVSTQGQVVTGSRTVYMSKTDGSGAFRTIPLKPDNWKWLVMAAEDPEAKVIKYFVDKCLPFGSSISCAIYQRYSNAVRHLVCYKMSVICVVNYLDDFLFVHYTVQLCNDLLRKFMELAKDITCQLLWTKQSMLHLL